MKQTSGAPPTASWLMAATSPGMTAWAITSVSVSTRSRGTSSRLASIAAWCVCAQDDDSLILDRRKVGDADDGVAMERGAGLASRCQELDVVHAKRASPCAPIRARSAILRRIHRDRKTFLLNGCAGIAQRMLLRARQ